MVACYVAGGRGRQLRPVLIPGNLVDADVRSKSETQLPFGKIELLDSRAPGLAVSACVARTYSDKDFFKIGA